MASLPSSSTLARDENWFRILAETTTTALFVFSGRLLYVNRAFEELTGYSQEELLSRSFASLVHAESRGVLSPDAGEEPASLETGLCELKIVRRDGEERWIECALATTEVDGRSAWLGTASDLTGRKQVDAALEESEERLRLVQQAGRSVTWEWFPATDRLTMSDYADQFFGFPVHAALTTGRDFQSLLHPEDRPRFRRAIGRLLKGSGDLSLEVRFVTPRGDVRWLAKRALAVRNAAGWTERVIGVAREITERKIAEDALFQEKERAHVTLASIADGVIRTDARGAVDYLNPVAQKLTGWALAEAYGRATPEIYRVEDQESGKKLFDPVEHCLSEGREVVFLGDRMLVHRDGRRFPVHDSAAPIRSRTGKVIGAVLVFKDLSQIREVEQQMVHLASHDPLTGLINRREFEARVRRLLLQGRADAWHALCHFDLDNFKLVQDTGGQAAGDQAIRQIAYLFQSQIREQDLLARLGADHFGLLLTHTEPAEAEKLTRGIVDAVRDFRVRWRDRLFATGVSVGLAPFTEASGDADELLRAATGACNVAKESGGDRVHVYQPGDAAIAEHYGEMHWISRIHRALDEERFRLFHQVIRPLDDELSEPPLAELFVRLVDEEGHLVSPDAFIPAAERYGLISTIDRWVVHTALDVLARRNGTGQAAATRFAINVSGKSLGVAEFLDLVIQEFERTGVEPHRILFEITETATIVDLSSAMRFISVTKEMGCRFVLDDFGQGLSSFGYLKNLPLDYLKIDGEFVRDMVTDPIQAALVASIHEIGDVMGLKTIAESVEDADTLDALKRIGVDYAQGFFIARPSPLVE